MEAIWAQSLNQVIGCEQSLPWSMPKDLAFFKEKTLYHPIVMGRKTFDSMNQRLLPNRLTIILTRQEDYHIPGAIVCHSIEEVLQQQEQFDLPLMIVGGEHLYHSFLPYCDTIYRTIVEMNVQGDAFAPNIPDTFHCVWQRFAPISDQNKESLIFEKWTI